MSVLLEIVPKLSVVDPGFPIGGALTHWGAPTSEAYTFRQKTYAKMKEIDPVGGAHTGSAPWICQ